MAAGRSSTGISPRPMLMGAAHDALRASNARVSLSCLHIIAHKLPHLFYGPVLSLTCLVGVPSCGLATGSWRTGRPAPHRQIVSVCLMLPEGFLCQGGVSPRYRQRRKVVFHSLRHSSTTYKLKLNHGDLKATQGDTGHAQIDMITSVYAHILDEDRKINAQKFESAFYANPDLRSVRPPEEPKESAPATLDLEALVEQLRNSPELANTLAALLASAPSEK